MSACDTRLIAPWILISYLVGITSVDLGLSQFIAGVINVWYVNPYTCKGDIVSLLTKIFVLNMQETRCGHFSLHAIWRLHWYLDRPWNFEFGRRQMERRYEPVCMFVKARRCKILQ